MSAPSRASCSCSFHAIAQNVRLKIPAAPIAVVFFFSFLFFFFVFFCFCFCFLFVCLFVCLCFAAAARSMVNSRGKAYLESGTRENGRWCFACAHASLARVRFQVATGEISALNFFVYSFKYQIIFNEIFWTRKL